MVLSVVVGSYASLMIDKTNVNIDKIRPIAHFAG
jgi:hypothetical protein